MFGCSCCRVNGSIAMNSFHYASVPTTFLDDAITSGDDRIEPKISIQTLLFQQRQSVLHSFLCQHRSASDDSSISLMTSTFTVFASPYVFRLMVSVGFTVFPTSSSHTICCCSLSLTYPFTYDMLFRTVSVAPIGRKRSKPVRQ